MTESIACLGEPVDLEARGNVDQTTEPGDLGHQLFEGYMKLLTQDDVFKVVAPCYKCGSARSPKDMLLCLLLLA